MAGKNNTAMPSSSTSRGKKYFQTARANMLRRYTVETSEKRKQGIKNALHAMRYGPPKSDSGPRQQAIEEQKKLADRLSQPGSEFVPVLLSKTRTALFAGSSNQRVSRNKLSTRENSGVFDYHRQQAHCTALHDGQAVAVAVGNGRSFKLSYGPPGV